MIGRRTFHVGLPPRVWQQMRDIREAQRDGTMPDPEADGRLRELLGPFVPERYRPHIDLITLHEERPDTQIQVPRTIH